MLALAVAFAATFVAMILWLDLSNLWLGLFTILLSFLALAALLVPWISFFMVSKLRKEKEQQDNFIAKLTSELESKGLIPPELMMQGPMVPPDPESRDQAVKDFREQAEAQMHGATPQREQPTAAPETTPAEVAAPSKPSVTPAEETAEDSAAATGTASPDEAGAAAREKTSAALERQFGARLPVWIGGIAIALSGLFLVKYSIDHNLMTPLVRVFLGGLMGGALLYGANWVHQRPSFANGVRIAQALTGAGIVTLYVSCYAATRLYQIIPGFLGFAGMAAITAASLVLALRHGAPIAVFGLVGGFTTPALLGAESPSALTLFMYLYCVFGGLMIIIRRRNWWALSLPTIVGAWLWVLCWIYGGSYSQGDSVWLALFLLAVSATMLINSRSKLEEAAEAGSAEALKPASLLNYIGLGGAVLLMGVVTAEANFGFHEWALFGLLAVGGIGLAYFNDRLYFFVPWMSMAVNAVTLALWDATQTKALLLTTGVFASIYMAAGYLIMWSSRTPSLWAGLTCATGIGYYLLAYFKLRLADVSSPYLFWGALALALAAGAIYTVRRLMQAYRHEAHKNSLLGIFAATATAFISIGLTIELDRDFLPVALALEILALCFIGRRVRIEAFRHISMALGLAFLLLMLPQLFLLLHLAQSAMIGQAPHLSDIPAIVKWPLFQLGLPALMFLGSSHLLRLDADGKLVRAFEVAALLLLSLTAYYVIKHMFHPDQEILAVKAGFHERGVITNVFFLCGLACFVIGRKFRRLVFSWSGVTLCAMALWRIAWFDLLLYNPLWSHQQIQGWPLLNSLLLPFGLPLLYTWLAARELSLFNKQDWSKHLTRATLLPLLFMLVSFNVRHLFQGEYLDGDITTNAEVYSYSAAWLLLGLGLLFAGAMRRDRALRYASLAVIVLVVTKVFLYDAPVLEGLFRVFSFLGLGLSLIGISWFYTRFVFGDKALAPPDSGGNGQLEQEAAKGPGSGS